MSKLFWPEARFEGFFGLREAVRPLEGQKIPKNGPKAKRVWTKRKTFLLSLQMENLVFIKSKMYFFIFGTSFLSEKDNFQAIKKFPWYKKS